MMKSIFLFCSFVFFTLLFAQAQTQDRTLKDSMKHIQMTKNRWTEDIDFLQNTVHKDFSFLFDKVSKNRFDNEILTLKKSLYINNLEDHEVVVELARIVSLFQYGHTNLNFGSLEYRNLFGFKGAPFKVQYYSDGIFISEATTDNEDLLGAKIISVESVPVSHVLSCIRPICPNENEQYFKQNAPNLIRYPQILHTVGITNTLKDKIELRLSKNGKSFSRSVKVSSPKKKINWITLVEKMNNAPLYLRDNEKYYFSEYLPDEKVLYVKQIGQQDDPKGKTIAEFYKEVYQFIEDNDVEKLVLDIRYNGGGNGYLNKPIITGAVKSKINKKGAFFVIIGKKTYSAAQLLVNELDNYTKAIFVGEPTSENINFYGDTETVILPNSQVPVFLSFAWWQDKPQWENNRWMNPDIYVDLNFQDFLSGRDPVLEAILNYNKTKQPKK